MHDEQSGSEAQGPGFVGPWAPPGDEAAQPADASRAGAPSPDVAPGRGETTPLIMPPGVAGPPLPGAQAGGYGHPGGYGQAGGYGQPGGYAQPEALGPRGDYRQTGGYGQPGGFAQQGGYAHADGPGQPGGYPPPGGYGPGYGQPGGFGPPGGFGAGQYPPGGYGPADYLQQPPPPRPGRTRGFLVYVLVAALAAGVGAGIVAAVENHDSTPVSQGSPNPGVNPNPGNNGQGNPFNNGNSPNSGTGVSNAKERAVASAVEPGVVDISSSLQYAGGNAEATGMVISSSGLVLTNNHVIDQTTALTATVVTTGQRFSARWLGYDKSDDVALIQLVGASGLRTVPLDNSSTVKVGDNVVAIGNAQGLGGTPTVVTGSITQLNQTITASDQLGGTETLHGMLQTNAQIVEGDSGGPLVNMNGRVIGMNTAASSGSFGNQTSDVGFAIPINRALSIARQIRNGQASSTITIGPTGFLGVLVPSQRASSLSSPAQQQRSQLSQQSSGFGIPGSGQCLQNDQNAGVPQNIAPVGTGTLVLGSLCGTPSARAGIVAGDVITAVGGHAVGSPDSLTAILQHYRPGTTVSVTWVDTSGGRHVGDLMLLQHPPY